MSLKFVEDSKRAINILNHGYTPEGEAPSGEEKFADMVNGMKELLGNLGVELGLYSHDELKDMWLSYDCGFGIHEPYQGDNLIRMEVCSWKMMTGGLMETISDYLKVAAPEFGVVFTTDIDDSEERALESPTIVILPELVIGEFRLCDLADTKTCLGFEK